MRCCIKKNGNTPNIFFVCPKCQDKGVKVQIITPQTLLKEYCKKKINTDLTYKFCKNSECEISYFSQNKSHFFIKGDLSVKATLKDQGLDVNLCYCFGHTRQSVLNGIKKTGKTTVLEEVKSKMNDPGCFCETSNPQGGCCLSNITAWIKYATCKQ